MRRHKIQKRLGYDLDTRLLIVHADDAGLCHSTNRAIFHCMEKGTVNSVSVMVTCPRFAEAAEYCRVNPGVDAGIHITLTSEWPDYKWGPVLPAEAVPTLVDDSGRFYGHDFYRHIDPADAEKEVGAQIETALDAGIEPTHLDCHMNCLFYSDALFKILVRAGDRHGIPFMVSKAYANHFNIDVDRYLGKDAVLANRIYMARPDNTPEGVPAYYRESLSSMQPGLNVMLVHPGFDDGEMRAVSRDVIPWGAEWRQADYEFYSGGECSRLLRENAVELITWREIRDTLLADAPFVSGGSR